jgi:hypothetical protein
MDVAPLRAADADVQTLQWWTTAPAREPVPRMAGRETRKPAASRAQRGGTGRRIAREPAGSRGMARKRARDRPPNLTG